MKAHDHPIAPAVRLLPQLPLLLTASLGCFAGTITAGESGPLTGYYGEPLRPQYHFTPQAHWMNDPNGLVFYQGEYHLFYQFNPFGNTWGHMSWGHAVSHDLIHWKHLPLALAEADGMMIFSGSAVVDWHNSSGFGKDGKPPLVAIYTGCRANGDGTQFECIAYSNDKGRTWTKYVGNPVIDRHSKDFRDPKVQWYEPSHQWIMTVSLSAEHKVCFYGSSNLKDWKLLSQFGPAGATGGVWECPDLFELPVEGTDERRWVLAVNINPGSVAGGSGGQYFIGQFDGTRFIADAHSHPQAEPEFVPPGPVIADFEGPDYGAWKTTGEAFGPGPATGRLADQNPVDGYVGHGLVNSYYHGDATTGTLTSPALTISRPYLNFLIGGGSQKETRMDLLVAGKVVRTASGQDSERLAWRSWDVREFLNQQATLQIVDQATGGWGHISVDQIMLADAPAHAASEAAQWFDYGPDYYAAVSWSDIPKSDGRRLWIGWMNNWEYGQEVPTSTWRSTMSIPREVGLRKVGSEILLVQKPAREVEYLREKHFVLQSSDVSAANAWITHNHIAGQQLELKFDLQPSTTGVQGVKVLQGAHEATVIGVNRDNGQVFVNRTQSGNANFDPKFSGVYSAPLAKATERVSLDIWVDAGSVEVFVNNGDRLFTALVFPAADSRNVEFFGTSNRAKINSLNVWTLKSCWK